MTAHSIPAELEQRDGYIGEWDVWNRLRREQPDGTTMLCGLKVPERGGVRKRLEAAEVWQPPRQS